MKPPTKRGRGRPPKYSRQVARQKTIDAGVAAVSGHGLEFGLDAATLEGAIVEADVPRGLSYRIWREESAEGDRPQDAFRIAVFKHIVHHAQSEWVPRCNEFSEAQVADYVAGRSSLQEIMRQIGFFCYELSQLDSLRLAHALRVTAWSRSGTPADVLAELHDGQAMLIEGYGMWFRDLIRAADLQLRSPYTTHDFSSALYSAGQAMTTSSPAIDNQREIIRPTGPNGTDQVWNVGGVIFEALLRQFFEWDGP